MDHDGRVLLHSWRAMSRLKDKQEAHFKGFLWAIESMRSHRVDNVIFARQNECLVNSTMKPAAWPSFRYQSMEFSLALKRFKAWKILLENSSSNNGALLIVQSVTNDCTLQSYVAVSHPSWLDGLFAEERRVISA
ncbi:PREDICTED: uncharacterized protein LOC104721123 [Camelina sativa]|uniref:Uncharacterized protein LOC104721123 n=1 Tax=Camelina sativa TaxID=90675 RepID=A0ABM0U832_CAMSA|nr:PREDICTED: uncharacterized protein LOC104721123 [Camelina sativa]